MLHAKIAALLGIYEEQQMFTSWIKPTIASLAFFLAASLCWMQGQETITKQKTILDTTALRLAPADCAYFTNSLKLKDRLLSLWNTKAAQQIWKTPLVQAGWIEVEKKWTEQSGPVQGFLAQKENQELFQLLLDMTSEECFMMGGANLAPFTDLMSGIFSNMYAGSIISTFDPTHDPVTSRIRAVLEALQEDLENVKAPDIIIGFKVNDAKIAQRQLARLAVLLNTAALAVPQLTGNVKNEKIGTSSFTTVTLDGAKFPWELIPWSDVEDEAGEFNELKEHLKKVKIKLCVGYHEQYILFGVGESLEFMKGMGKGKKLADIAEFQPLMKNLDKQIHGVSYSSKEMNSRSGFTEEQSAAMVDQFTKMLEDSDLEDDDREAIQKDIEDLGKDIYRLMGHEPGAAMSFSFGTDRGEETMAYQYSIDRRTNYSKPLDILQHVGGSPLLAVAGRSMYHPQTWDIVVKWVKKGEHYFREYALPMVEQTLGAEWTKNIETLLDDLHPVMKRLDQTVRINFIPALSEGQSAFVIDNRLVSTQWHQALPTSKQPLPMLEPAILFSVTNREKLKQGAADVRSIFNDSMKLVQKLHPEDIPEIHWPAPESRKIDDADLFWYAFPDEAKLDARLRPSAALGKNICALAVSNEHAIRLLQLTPLNIDSKPLADLKRPLSGATIFHMAGLLDTAVPWVTYMLEQPEMSNMRNYAKDVQTIIQSLKYIQSYSSATFMEGNATVTHSEWRVKDIR